MIPVKKKIDQFSTICPCGGTLFNITSNLAEAMELVHLRCDKCNKTWAIDTKRKTRTTPRGRRR